jgi:hypothetical protein
MIERPALYGQNHVKDVHNSKFYEDLMVVTLYHASIFCFLKWDARDLVGFYRLKDGL